MAFITIGFMNGAFKVEVQDRGPPHLPYIRHLQVRTALLSSMVVVHLMRSSKIIQCIKQLKGTALSLLCLCNLSRTLEPGHAGSLGEGEEPRTCSGQGKLPAP